MLNSSRPDQEEKTENQEKYQRFQILTVKFNTLGI